MNTAGFMQALYDRLLSGGALNLVCPIATNGSHGMGDDPTIFPSVRWRSQDINPAGEDTGGSLFQRCVVLFSAYALDEQTASQITELIIPLFILTAPLIWVGGVSIESYNNGQMLEDEPSRSDGRRVWRSDLQLEFLIRSDQ